VVHDGIPSFRTLPNNYRKVPHNLSSRYEMRPQSLP